MLTLRTRAAALIVTGACLTGCGTSPSAPSSPEAVRAHIADLLPPSVADRPGWALDVYAAFEALRLDPSTPNLCAVLAVAEQESGFRVDPAVPGLGRIARAEIDRRADQAGVPRLLVNAALGLRSPDSRSWDERIAAARTEKQLSDVFEDFIAQVPLGQRFFTGYNPVRTGGPMQVGVAFAQKQVSARGYPYRMAGSVRDEVFSRRGGMYFGIAHLLDYPAPYDGFLYRFADFNAGRYASRNAAFQSAVAMLTGTSLELDGDLAVRDGDPARPGATEAAVRILRPRLGATEGEIRRELLQQDEASFERTRVWTRTFELADAAAGHAAPRAVLPRIRLQSPKITRPLTTEWFARRVDERFRRCLAKSA